MIVIEKQAIIDKLDALIEAREQKKCTSRQTFVEIQAFNYAKAIVNSIEEKEIEE